jgi:tetratricopeptide (TPR) repeat protein
MSRAIEQLPDRSAMIATESGGPWIDPDGRQLIRIDLLGRASPEAWERRGVRYLVATGREEQLPAGSPDSLLGNRARIDKAARRVWQQGKYVLYDLGPTDDALVQARRLLEAGRVEEARVALAAYCRGDSATSAAVLLLGDACLAAADTVAAVEAYQRAARIDPRDPTPHVALGMIAFQSHRLDDAVAAYGQARALSPRDPFVAGNLAFTLLHRAQASFAAGRREAAAADLRAAAQQVRMALSQDPQEPRYRRLEAMTRELSNRWGVPAK